MSAHVALQMKTLMGQMQGWLDVIRRGTAAHKVEIVPKDGGQWFTVLVHYKLKDGSEKIFESNFTAQRVFGASMQGNANAWRIQRRGCDYAREVLREVLQHRGVI